MPGRVFDTTEMLREANTGAASASVATGPSLPLEELAWQCTRNAIAVSQYLDSQNLPQPSHEAHGPSRTLPKDSPEWVQKSRQNLMDAALQLFQLAAGPSEFVPNLAPGVQYTACLAWLLRFDIFHLVPASGTISYTGLVAAAFKKAKGAAPIPEQRLKSIMRMAMTAGLFREPQPGQVCHSATSALLARDPDVHAWASYFSTRSAPTALAMTAAHDQFSPATVAKSETAYNVAFNTELPFFDHLSLDPAGIAEFAGYMRNVQTSDAVDLKHLVHGYPWAEIGSGLVVDVGGSTGSGAVALAKSFPALNFVVQDLPKNAEAGAQMVRSEHPHEIASRISFQGHDFTQPQPVTNGQVYLLRMILHDWPDHVAVEILKNLLPALRGSDSKLLIMDTVLPAPGQVASAVERIVRVRDLTMMQVFNSQERDMEQWRQLLDLVDKDLKINRVLQPFGSAMAFLEIAYDDATDAASASSDSVAEEMPVENGWDITG